MELGALLERRDQLLPVAKEFEALDEQVKEAAKAIGTGDKVCGDYLLRVLEQNRTKKITLTFREEEQTVLVTKILKLN